MFTDIKGFSDLAAIDEDAALDLLRAHNKIMKPIVSAYRGTILKTMGDAIMGKFSAASDALDCALEMQLRLKRWNVGRPRNEQILVRIGVHVGDVVTVKHDILGVVTNLAKRLESVAPVGHVCCTDAARLMVLHLPRYKFRHVGRWHPKGSRREIDFYSVSLRRPREGR
jgi:adenylate cyclase